MNDEQCLDCHWAHHTVTEDVNHLNGGEDIPPLHKLGWDTPLSLRLRVL